MHKNKNKHKILQYYLTDSNAKYRIVHEWEFEFVQRKGVINDREFFL